MEFDEYKTLVVTKALELRNGKGPICIDTILESFMEGASIDEAANDAAMNTDYWEYGTIPS